MEKRRPAFWTKKETRTPMSKKNHLCASSLHPHGPTRLHHIQCLRFQYHTFPSRHQIDNLIDRHRRSSSSAFSDVVRTTPTSVPVLTHHSKAFHLRTAYNRKSTLTQRVSKQKLSLEWENWSTHSERDSPQDAIIVRFHTCHVTCTSVR